MRTVFKYGYESGIITQPVRFGPQFKKPSKSVLRKQRAEGGKKLFTREQVLALLEVASVPMQAMVLLAVNAGLGNSDCGSLRMKHLDLKTNWLQFPRPKTGIERRAFLWPETVAAVKNRAGRPPTPKDPANADLVFVTKSGKYLAKGYPDVTHEMGKMLAKPSDIESEGLGFYGQEAHLQDHCGRDARLPGDPHDDGAADPSWHRRPLRGGYRRRPARLAVAEHVRALAVRNSPPPEPMAMKEPLPRPPTTPPQTKLSNLKSASNPAILSASFASPQSSPNSASIKKPLRGHGRHTRTPISTAPSGRTRLP